MNDEILKKLDSLLEQLKIHNNLLRGQASKNGELLLQIIDRLDIIIGLIRTQKGEQK